MAQATHIRLSSLNCDKMIHWIVLFLLSFLVCCATITTAQDPTPAPNSNGSSAWTGCINPDDPTASTLVRIGQPTAICLTIGPGGNWASGVNYLRFIFTPKADVYSKFVIPNCTYKYTNYVFPTKLWILSNNPDTFVSCVAYQDIVNGETALSGTNLTVFAASQTT